MRALGDKMAAAERPLKDDELVEYILTGLDLDFNPIVSALVARTEPIFVNEVYSQLLAFETRLEIYTNNSGSSSVNSASRGSHGSAGNRGRGTGRGRGAGRGRSNASYSNNSGNSSRQGGHPARGGGGRGYNNNNSNSRPTCQVCYKYGHSADKCWHRFDEDYVPDERHAAAALGSNNIDNNWYTDTGATDHIAGDLEKLAVHVKYNGTDQILTANGAEIQ
ncbi:hypothetical protein U9M48_013721 [Paspalum notatum var. saurae]|uniref:Uncharacterized protein n=1 Tax=Paspalum notatum var. saurae TaxID=547442 RepID=A0AAQ3SZW9_PASNO